MSERRFMEDAQIVQLFFERSEEAITQAQSKYAGYCRSIALNVLADEQDALECVNDCLFRTWNRFPLPAIVSSCDKMRDKKESLPQIHQDGLLLSLGLM